MAYCNNNCACGLSCWRQDDHGGECDCGGAVGPCSAEQSDEVIEDIEEAAHFWHDIVRPALEHEGNITLFLGDSMSPETILKWDDVLKWRKENK